MPGSSFATTAILGGGWGLTSTLEVGGQLVPVAISQIYSTRTVALHHLRSFARRQYHVAGTDAPGGISVALRRPLHDDVGAALAVNIGAWGEIETAPTLSINLHQDGNGTSLSLPLTVMRQASARLLNSQLSIGVGFARFDPRFALSRRTDALDFNDVTIPASAQVMYTVPRDASADLVDIALQGQFPQLYTNRPELRGWQTNDWTVQLQRRRGMS